MPTYNFVLEQVTVEIFRYWLERDWDFFVPQYRFLQENDEPDYMSGDTVQEMPVWLKAVREPDEYEAVYMVESETRLWGSICVQKTSIDQLSVEVFEFSIGKFSQHLSTWMQEKFSMHSKQEIKSVQAERNTSTETVSLDEFIENLNQTRSTQEWWDELCERYLTQEKQKQGWSQRKFAEAIGYSLQHFEKKLREYRAEKEGK